MRSEKWSEGTLLCGDEGAEVIWAAGYVERVSGLLRLRRMLRWGGRVVGGGGRTPGCGGKRATLSMISSNSFVAGGGGLVPWR